MDSKYTQRMLKAFPNSFALVDNENDPVHAIIHEGSLLLSELEREKEREIKNLSISSCDPALSNKVYFVECNDVEDMHRINLVPNPGGCAKLCNNETDFISNEITGFDFVETLQPSGIFSSGILGLVYGFDWESSRTYITASGSNYVYEYATLEDSPNLLDYAYVVQSYTTAGEDEWLNLDVEVAGSGTIPDGILPSDEVKVAYLAHIPEGTVTIIDVGNLKNPDDADSDGIIVNSNDYIVDGNRIVFVMERSDYVPAILTTVVDVPMYVYPYNYQPDRLFTSSYIAEYKYRAGDDPRYISTQTKLHDLSVVEDPAASY